MASRSSSPSLVHAEFWSGPQGPTRRGVVLAALATVAGVRPTVAQTPAPPMIGYLAPESPQRFASRLRAFHDGLAEVGFVEGQSVLLEYRWAEGRYDRLQRLARELSDRNVAVLVATGGAQSALAAKAASEGRSVVFEMGGDPVKVGVVDSLPKPGANITGVSSLSVEVSAKRLEFIRDVFPRAAQLAVAVNPTSPTARSQIESLQMAAAGLNVDLAVMEVRSEDDLGTLFAATAASAGRGLVFTSDPYFAFRSEMLAALAMRHRVAAITQSRDFPLAGGLMSYGGDFMQSHKRAGVYAGRILRGEKPFDLPVQQVTKVEMVINLETARMLGLDLAGFLLSRADEVIG
ncbi:ABC transporter substrate-binding protein [Alsobacter sp. R-9]